LKSCCESLDCCWRQQAAFSLSSSWRTGSKLWANPGPLSSVTRCSAYRLRAKAWSASTPPLPIAAAAACCQRTVLSPQPKRGPLRLYRRPSRRNKGTARRHKGGLLTLVERKTQLAKITKLPRATARATQKAAVRRLRPIGDFVHTITFDNGKEFAAHQDIAHALKTKIFFATPYHEWERGLNENTNGLIRDFFPKGTDFSTISRCRGCQGRTFAQRETSEIPRLSFTSRGFPLPRLLLNFYALGS